MNEVDLEFCYHHNKCMRRTIGVGRAAGCEKLHCVTKPFREAYPKSESLSILSEQEMRAMSGEARANVSAGLYGMVPYHIIAE